MEFTEGTIVITSTAQAGTVVQNAMGTLWVLLRNGELWIGNPKMCRLPQNQEDLEACPVDVERFN